MSEIALREVLEVTAAAHSAAFHVYPAKCPITLDSTNQLNNKILLEGLLFRMCFVINVSLLDSLM